MNEMHFDGKITKADFHNSGVVGSSIQLWMLIDITQEVLLEDYGSAEELAKKYELPVSTTGNYELSGLTGRHCKVLRNAQGYHFVTFT